MSENDTISYYETHTKEVVHAITADQVMPVSNCTEVGKVDQVL